MGTAAGAIDDNISVIDAFVKFANLEDEFETLEGQIYEMAVAFEWAVQAEIDRQRGK